MTCARQRRLESEAHDRARDECLASAEKLGLHMCCADEFECTDTLGCGFFKRAMADVIAEDGMMP